MRRANWFDVVQNLCLAHDSRAQSLAKTVVAQVLGGGGGILVLGGLGEETEETPTCIWSAAVFCASSLVQLTRPLAHRYRGVVSFYRYLEECDVHLLDCAGKVDVPVGLARLQRLSRELEARPARDGVHRLLIDFRRTEWASEDAHRQLSQATRRDFGLNAENPSLRLAFVFQGGKGIVSKSERWFADDTEALAWLVSGQTADAG